MIVVLLQDHEGFDKGDVISVPDEKAKELIKAGLAEEYKVPGLKKGKPK